MTLFYGWEWLHSDLTSRTHRLLVNLVGVANLETFRQIYFILLRRRLTTREGENKYVLKENFDKFWTFPTLFAHGRDNQLYRPDSAVASYLRLREFRRLPRIINLNYDVYWFEAPNCGHFDFLFGKNGYWNVYPYLDAFFRRARGAPLDELEEVAKKLDDIPLPERDPFWERKNRPEYGPIIGWVDQSDKAHITFRLWVEPIRFSAIPPSGTIADPLPASVNVEPSLILPETGYPGTYWVYDITVPRDFGKGRKDGKGLRISVDYTNREEIKFKVETVDLQQSDDLLTKDELRDPRGIIIPLTKLSWFQHLQGKNSDHAAFLVSSCRYPGSPFDESLADRIFEAMRQHVNDSEGRRGIDHVLMVGDQIYADATADIFETRNRRERFAQQYREAFGAPHMRRFLASVPTYMALDDHEFDDNWPDDSGTLNPTDPIVKRSRENFQHGLAGAEAYQWSMSRRDGRTSRPNPHPPDDSGLWHTFESGGLPFFVMDTRTERTLRQADVSWDKAQLVGPRQFKVLTDWLQGHKEEDKPKFIVSGSVLAPVAREFIGAQWQYRKHDGWAGYPATWQALAQYIVEEEIHKVVFIAGDSHFSALAKLTFSSNTSKKPSVTAYQIVASALFAPLPFANADPYDYDWGAPLPGRPPGSVPYALPFSNNHAAIHNAAIHVEPYLLCTRTSHFLRVDVQHDSGWTIDISVCDRTGVIKPEMAVKPPFKTNANNVVSWDI